MELTHFSLFSGIGGIDLAAEWAGFKTVGQCEFADYPTKVLEKHWPDVPKWRDIRSVTAKSFYERTGLRTVDLISGGFPCQPFSVAGKRKGDNDDRYLWPEMCRVISELQPTWVIGENVAGIISMEKSDCEIIMEDETTICKETEMVLETIRRDFERIGYKSQPILIPACAVGARHRRNRIFIIANTNSARRNKREKVRGGGRNIYGQNRKTTQETSQRDSINGIGENGSHEHVANTDSEPKSQTSKKTCPIREKWNAWNNACWSCGRCNTGSNWWATEPGVGRVANGVPNRVDRLKCLGNAVVPQQVYPILQAIADIERRAVYGEVNNEMEQIQRRSSEEPI